LFYKTIIYSWKTGLDFYGEYRSAEQGKQEAKKDQVTFKAVYNCLIQLW